MKTAILKSRRFLAPMTLLMCLAATAGAAVPGISGTAFNLTAQPAYLNQPDGASIYSWGYGCPPNSSVTFVPAAIAGATCPTMQVPGPTLVVTEGQTITVTLTNNLPTAAGNTSILFPGFTLSGTSCSTGAVQGLLTCEAPPGGTVTYTFVASAPGTHAYYSGTQGDLQIEMGLYGAVVVLPLHPPANCDGGYHALNVQAKTHWGEQDFRLAHAAYDHPGTCYDREYLFQWAEMDPRIHKEALAQATALAGCIPFGMPGGSPACSLNVQTEPYHPAYYLINGRSMPDLMDPNYAPDYPNQPYNGNPHMHPGDLTLIRTIGQGRWQHPFHEHANHVRILARDANLVLTSTAAACSTTSGTPVTPAPAGCITYSTGIPSPLPGSDTPVAAPGLAGILMFNTDTTPGESFDGIFYFSGRGLNWDMFGHHAPLGTALAGTAASDSAGDPLATLPCTPDVNGYNTGNTTVGTTLFVATHQVNYFEWCQDHNKPIQVNPFGDVEAGGPVTLPDPNVFTNGAWYGGSLYFGPDATLRGNAPACVGSPYGALNPTSIPGTPATPGGTSVRTANCTNLAPANLQLNPANERGWAFMWHSHNEREITTNNVFPGGMLMMMLVDSREFVIDESM